MRNRVSERESRRQSESEMELKIDSKLLFKKNVKPFIFSPSTSIRAGEGPSLFINESGRVRSGSGP